MWTATRPGTQSGNIYAARNKSHNVSGVYKLRAGGAGPHHFLGTHTEQISASQSKATLSTRNRLPDKGQQPGYMAKTTSPCYGKVPSNTYGLGPGEVIQAPSYNQEPLLQAVSPSLMPCGLQQKLDFFQYKQPALI
jgi:hypothetical protein